MLILSRKVGESLFMPSLGIEFRVLEIRPHVVRIGIEAPRSVAILRDDAIDTRGVLIHTEVRNGDMPSDCQRCGKAIRNEKSGVCAADAAAASCSQPAFHQREADRSKDV